MNIHQSIYLPALILLSACFSLLPISLQSQPVWEEFGELSFPRGFHNAHYIGNGKVLVMGGFNYSESTPTATTLCELIDVRSGTVEPAHAMQAPHAEAVSLLTRDSNVIVVSGLAAQFERGALTGNVEMYNRVSGMWTTLGTLNIARRQHVAAFISDHEILVVGGRHQNHQTMADAEIFDINTGKSRTAASFPFPISTASMEIASNGDVVVLGGRAGGANSERRDTVYRYDIQRNRWSHSGRLEKPLQATCMLKLWDGRIVLSGGSYSEDPIRFTNLVQMENNGEWQTVGSMQTERQWGSSAQLDNSIVLTGGGYDNRLTVMSSCDFVDVNRNSVSPGPPLIHQRSFHTFVTVPRCTGSDGNIQGVDILAIGGRASLTGYDGPTSIEILRGNYLPGSWIDAGPDTTICSGNAVTLGGVPAPTCENWQLQYSWQPSNGLSCRNCLNPIASPKRTTQYILTARDGSGNQWFDTVVVTIAPDSIHSHIPTNITGIHGELIELPIFLDDSIDTKLLENSELHLRYDPMMMHPVTPILLEGGILDGWNVKVVSDYAGQLTIRLEAGNNALFVHSNGLLLRITMATYIDGSYELPLPDSASIPFELDLLSFDCVEVICKPGFVVLGDQATSSAPLETEVSFGLRSTGANPFHGKTELRFELANTSHTVLTVYDMLGIEVMRLVDERMEQGEHIVEWDASNLPQGVYLCQLSSNGRNDSRLVVLKK
ncbi:MAG: T9SS type A sorting domain-containing protein [Ignavibacteriae bacterium]|nr:T9SS type A sorting domain-containing protein [Ignavibacteriota bacterium]MCB9216428.1 T9SS type A sorting domain-containing protein [Ignavibacteria bacterium]